MPKYLLSRLVQSVVLVVVVSIVMFALIASAPGGPAILYQEDVTAEAAATMRRNLGLDDPVVVQYVRWASAMVQGDLGTSLSNSRPVSLLIGQRFGATAQLALASLALALVVAIPIGVLSAVRRNGWFDRIATATAFMGVSIPNFWLGIMMIVLFSVSARLAAQRRHRRHGRRRLARAPAPPGDARLRPRDEHHGAAHRATPARAW